MQADPSTAVEPLQDAAPAEPVRAHLHSPIDVRSASLGVIAPLASVYVLHWAGAVFIPLLLGLMCSYALSPVVDRLQRWHVPRSIGAAALLVALLGALGTGAYALSDDASLLVESLPDAAQQLRESMRTSRGTPEGPIEKVQRAAARLEQAAEESRWRSRTSSMSRPPSTMSGRTSWTWSAWRRACPAPSSPRSSTTTPGRARST
jgi:predicted PurR-regulated permease PerM